jgi:intracellular septation protein A
MALVRNQLRRGWVAFGAGVFLIVFMSAIWFYIDHAVTAGGALQDPEFVAFMGRINIACGLVVVAGILGAINGWIMAHSAKRTNWLIIAMIVVFGFALYLAYTASTVYHGS